MDWHISQHLPRWDKADESKDASFFIFMIYLAEFAVIGTMELADEILIFSESKADARSFALRYASNWGIDLYSLRSARKEYLNTIRCHNSMPQSFTQPRHSTKLLNASTVKAEESPNNIPTLSVVGQSQ